MLTSQHFPQVCQKLLSRKAKVSWGRKLSRYKEPSSTDVAKIRGGPKRWDSRQL